MNAVYYDEPEKGAVEAVRDLARAIADVFYPGPLPEFPKATRLKLEATYRLAKKFTETATGPDEFLALWDPPVGVPFKRRSNA